MTARLLKAPTARRKPKGRFHHGDLAEQLVIVATQLVEEKGHLSFSLRELAGRLGVTEPAIYRHYQNRDALLAEVALRGFVRWDDAMLAAMERIDDPFEVILAGGKQYVRFAVENPGWFRLQFSRTWAEEMQRSPLIAQRFTSGNVSSDQRLREALEATLPADAKDRLPDLNRLVWSTAHGVAMLVVERSFYKVQTDAERIAAADTTLELLIDAMRALKTNPSKRR